MMNLARDTCSGWMVGERLARLNQPLNDLYAMVVAKEGFESVLGKTDGDCAHR